MLPSEASAWLLAPTPPPSSPGMYGPLVLSKPSTSMPASTWTFVHEQSAQVKVVAPGSPLQPTPPTPTSMGGPEPPSHFAGGSNTAASMQLPATQPWPAPHSLPQLPQFLLSVEGLPQPPSQGELPGRQSVVQPPAEQTSPA